MITCKLCDKELTNNLGGDLTKHLRNDHNLDLPQYIIITEYNNIKPKCECGFCDDVPVFYRGMFKKYACEINQMVAIIIGLFI